MLMGQDAELAINGGPKAVQTDVGDIFTWPIITSEDEEAVLEVLRRGAMSGIDVTKELEREFAAWHGMEYALGHSSGTAALQAAMWGCEMGIGDEIIAPSFTYWASALPALSLQATVVFAEVEPHSLCLDPNDIEHRITERTKAIMAVHLRAYPADMDPILEIARRHDVKVIEDFSQAHGTTYKGRLVGTMGDVGACSLMSGKSLACGEAGMLVSNNRRIWERAIVWGHKERTAASRWTGELEEKYVTEPDLVGHEGYPWGGYKYRMHQLSSAVCRVQLKYYKERIAEIDKAMSYFWDLLEGVPGIKAHRVAKDSGSGMGGWFGARGLYVPEELGGLDIERYCEAVSAEGVACGRHTVGNLHLHPLFNTADIYGHGKPTRIANSERDVRQPEGSLPVTESLQRRVLSVPWFKHYDAQIIEEHAAAFRKVAENVGEVARE